MVTPIQTTAPLPAVYHEGVGSKGGNNVCSLIHKTLEMMGLLQENDSGLELNIVFDNSAAKTKTTLC
jgi:hypothetical protein